MSDSFATQRTVAHQAPLSMGFPRQEYWSGLPFPSLGGSSPPRDGTSLSLASLFREGEMALENVAELSEGRSESRNC